MNADQLLLDNLNLILTAVSSTAAVFSAILFLPQMFKSLITRNTADTTLYLFGITIAADIFWLSFGGTLFAAGNGAGAINLMWQNSFVTLVALVLFTIKFYNMYKSKKMNMTEAQWCNKLNAERKAKRQNPNSGWSKFVDILAGDIESFKNKK